MSAPLPGLASTPLDDVRVLDLSRLLPGPFATLVLADMGATVDKIEDPGQGDYLRHMPPQVGEQNVAFGMLNRGKRSAVLDLKRSEGQRALSQMVGTYDVLFEQFRPGVLARLGLDPATLRERHPRLIICSLTGYGQTGPLAMRAGHDLNYLARAGVLGAQGPASQAPQLPGFQLADISGGLWSVVAILAALRHRDHTGEGAWLDIAMSEGTVPFYLTSLGAALAGHPGRRGDEQLTGAIAPYGVYPTKDGRWLTLAALEPKFWITFCSTFGREPSMSDLVPGEHQVQVKAWVEGVTRAKTVDEWRAYAGTHDVPIEPVLSLDEVAGDEHLAARQVFTKIATPDGDVPQVRTPVTPRREPSETKLAPRQGEQTRLILEQAGLAGAVIDELFAAGVAR
ncbi:MAG: CoA transferase [Polyangiaceae bacterium]|nr:CoA transferase [Polyangiaceae bacterium]